VNSCSSICVLFVIIKHNYRAMHFILVVFLSQVFFSFLTICTVLFYFSVSCFVTVMAVLETTLILLLLINLDFGFSAKRSIEIACRLSVCPSVTLVDQDHISRKSCKLIARTISPTPSLFVAQRPFT